MKALTQRLEWIKLHLWSLPDGMKKTSLLDVYIEIEAIADALPEITLPADWQPPPPPRKPTERVIELPTA